MTNIDCANANCQLVNLNVKWVAEQRSRMACPPAPFGRFLAPRSPRAPRRAVALPPLRLTLASVLSDSRTSKCLTRSSPREHVAAHSLTDTGFCRAQIIDDCLAEDLKDSSAVVTSGPVQLHP